VWEGVCCCVAWSGVYAQQAVLHWCPRQEHLALTGCQLQHSCVSAAGVGPCVPGVCTDDMQSDKVTTYYVSQSLSSLILFAVPPCPLTSPPSPYPGLALTAALHAPPLPFQTELSSPHTYVLLM
jgi:hypothetical protein